MQDAKVNNNSNSDTLIVKTDIGAVNGQNKCPKCGATDISLNVQSGKLVCNFCHFEFEESRDLGFNDNVSELSGKVIGSGAVDIDKNVSDIITLKCSSCGAEVVIDTASSASCRCHWCRNVLSVNERIPNGNIPDVVLPFKVTRDEARKKIENFVGKREFFANPKFVREFTTDNIMGVYFPYMIVDINSHAKLVGQGEHLIREYTVGNGEHAEVRYDAELYDVSREYDLVINGLTVESSQDKLNNDREDKTVNVINAIMPFDVENCVKFDANYLRGYTSDARDTNVSELKEHVLVQAKDISRHAANVTLTKYDRGVAWRDEDLQILGEQWKAAYLPVWLYSYLEGSGANQKLHYVAVNARTMETMGSVPIHMPKLLFVSFVVECFGVFTMMNVDFDYNWLFLFVGIVYFMFMYLRYRNSNARHKHECDTKTKMSNLSKVDTFVKRRNGLRRSRIEGANNNSVSGVSDIGEVLDTVVTAGKIINIVKDITDDR